MPLHINVGTWLWTSGWLCFIYSSMFQSPIISKKKLIPWPPLTPFLDVLVWLQNVPILLDSLSFPCLITKLNGSPWFHSTQLAFLRFFSIQLIPWPQLTSLEFTWPHDSLQFSLTIQIIGGIFKLLAKENVFLLSLTSSVNACLCFLFFWLRIHLLKGFYPFLK